MVSNRFERTTMIEADTVMDDSDRHAMQIGYAVLRYHPELLPVLNDDRKRAREECKNSYGKEKEKEKEWRVH